MKGEAVPAAKRRCGRLHLNIKRIIKQCKSPFGTCCSGHIMLPSIYCVSSVFAQRFVWEMSVRFELAETVCLAGASIFRAISHATETCCSISHVICHAKASRRKIRNKAPLNLALEALKVMVLLDTSFVVHFLLTMAMKTHSLFLLPWLRTRDPILKGSHHRVNRCPTSKLRSKFDHHDA